MVWFLYIVYFKSIDDRNHSNHYTNPKCLSTVSLVTLSFYGSPHPGGLVSPHIKILCSVVPYNPFGPWGQPGGGSHLSVSDSCPSQLFWSNVWPGRRPLWRQMLLHKPAEFHWFIILNRLPPSAPDRLSLFSPFAGKTHETARSVVCGIQMPLFSQSSFVTRHVPQPLLGLNFLGQNLPMEKKSSLKKS